MRKHQREVRGIVAEECEKARALGYSIDHTDGNHLVVKVVRSDEATRKIFLALSPSDVRAIHNFRSNLRKALRGDLNGSHH